MSADARIFFSSFTIVDCELRQSVFGCDVGILHAEANITIMVTNADFRSNLIGFFSCLACSLFPDIVLRVLSGKNYKRGTSAASALRSAVCIFCVPL